MGEGAKSDLEKAIDYILSLPSPSSRALHVLKDMPEAKALEQLGFDFRDGRLHAPGLGGPGSEVVVTSHIDANDEVKFNVEVTGIDPDDLVEIIERIYQARNKTDG